MYKENVIIESWDTEYKTVNIETVGKRVGCYRYYFRCVNCKNQSIADDEGTIYSCINCRTFTDTNDEKVYCENYCKAKDGE